MKNDVNKIANLEYEIEFRTKEMNEWYEELKKYDPTTYSYPFHQAKKIAELRKELEILKRNLKCPYCLDDEQDNTLLPNGLCVYHNYFFGNR